MKDRKPKSGSDGRGEPSQAEEVLAVFGETQVVKVGGRLELRGGPMADRMEAMEWLSMFMLGEEVGPGVNAGVSAAELREDVLE